MIGHRASRRVVGLLIACGAALGGEAPPGVVGRGLDRIGGGRVVVEAPAGGALVLVFYSSECPISNAYTPDLNALAASAPAGRLRVVGLCVDPDATDAALSDHAREYRIAFPTARDRDGSIARSLGVKVTPEAAVLDAAGAVRYVGRIDDQWAARRTRNGSARTHELQEAVGAVLAGRPVASSRVPAVGCPLPEVRDRRRGR